MESFSSIFYSLTIKITSLVLFPTTENAWQYHTLCYVLKFGSTDKGKFVKLAISCSINVSSESATVSNIKLSKPLKIHVCYSIILEFFKNRLQWLWFGLIFLVCKRRKVMTKYYSLVGPRPTKISHDKLFFIFKQMLSVLAFTEYRIISVNIL